MKRHSSWTFKHSPPVIMPFVMTTSSPLNASGAYAWHTYCMHAWLCKLYCQDTYWKKAQMCVFMCANHFIWRRVHPCDLAFCLSAALQSTNCILTQSLRHKWEHQNLSAVSRSRTRRHVHTLRLSSWEREWGRREGRKGWTIYLQSLLF